MFYLRMTYPTLRSFFIECEQAGDFEKAYDLVFSFHHVNPKFH